MGFSRKGRIRTGMDADLLVFDPEIIRDRAVSPASAAQTPRRKVFVLSSSPAKSPPKTGGQPA